jgi:hypothetical protein
MLVCAALAPAADSKTQSFSVLREPMQLKMRFCFFLFLAMMGGGYSVRN